MLGEYCRRLVCGTLTWVAEVLSDKVGVLVWVGVEEVEGGDFYGT